ncbi:MAG: hypothetical protein ACXWWU_08175, partial [Candidatus Limnocylindria bacterium]
QRAAATAQAAAAQAASEQPSEPATPDGRRKRSTHAPEKGGVDWGDVAKEGARFTRSGTFNTILRGIIRGLGGRR